MANKPIFNKFTEYHWSGVSISTIITSFLH